MMVQHYNLMVAPNGARLTPADHPALPITPEQLAATAKACFDAGAGTIHLHVRDDKLKHSLDPRLYKDAIAAVKKQAPRIRIQITTEAVGIFDVSEQIACIEGTRPEAVSMSVREFSRDPELTAKAYDVATRVGADIEHIVYDQDDVFLLLDHMKKGVIPTSARNVLCVLGRYTDGQVSKPSDLDPFLDAMRGHELTWSVCAFGQNELDCLLYGLKKGGNARIGFENNRLSPEGETLPDNQTSVRTFVAAAAALGFYPNGLKS